jgi:predicted nucleic acid-binding protein
VLDLLLDREPFVMTAAELFVRVEQGELIGLLGATTITTIHYLATKVVGIEQARQQIEKLLLLFEIAPINRAVLAMALLLKFKDFEDAVLHEAGRHAGAQGIVTRNPKDFKQASLLVYSPEELSRALAARRRQRG